MSRAYWRNLDAWAHVDVVRAHAYKRYQRRMAQNAGLTLVLEAERLVAELVVAKHTRHAEFGSRRFD